MSPQPDMTLEFLDEPLCVVLRIEGPVRADSGVQWYEAATGDPRYRDGMALVFDVTGADFSEVSISVLRAYLLRMRTHASTLRGGAPDLPVAIVAPSDLAFGIGRMFASMASGEFERPRVVVRTLEAALDWLRRGPADRD